MKLQSFKAHCVHSYTDIKNTHEHIQMNQDDSGIYGNNLHQESIENNKIVDVVHATYNVFAWLMSRVDFEGFGAKNKLQRKLKVNKIIIC